MDWPLRGAPETDDIQTQTVTNTTETGECVESSV